MVDWAGYLGLAPRLAAEDGEAELRSAVSRAYYSAYNDARRYVRHKAPMFSGKDEQHWLVWDWFASEPGQAATTTSATIHSAACDRDPA